MEFDCDQFHASVVKYLDYAASHYDTKDTGHNFEHIKRICRCVPRLTAGLDAALNIERLCALAAFHGLWPKLRDDASFRQDTKSFLSDLEWSDADIEDLFVAVSRHFNDSQTIEEDIIHDANNLERVGALGIAKAFTVGGARHQTYEETIGYCTRNLLEASFKTPAAQKIAEEAREFAANFLKRLEREL